VTQPTLFDPPVVDKPLTDRQQFVVELLQRAGREGLAADEVGANLCERKGKHPAGDRCEWCSKNGLQVLRSLRSRHGKVKSRRNGSWYALDGVIEPDPPGMTNEIPF
jgi:hypothetical protein